MRGAIEGMAPPESLAAGLPPAFFGNDFTRGMIEAFDQVLVPVFATLDDFDAYLDPRYAPEDFLRWLAGWLGFPLDERWPAERLREQLADAVEALLWRGTVRGVAAAVRAYTGVQPEVQDTGGVSSSARPLGRLPGDPRPRLVVRVPAGGYVDPDVLERIVAEVKPAHVAHEIILSERSA
ncbi:MAG TPA: phage tail protein [Micromonosporaceae bacterium]|nr:phage tail protein [Micromonosporaceae bacterium]